MTKQKRFKNVKMSPFLEDLKDRVMEKVLSLILVAFFVFVAFLIVRLFI